MPECVAGGLAAVFEEQWYSEAKFVIWIGDAPAHGTEYLDPEACKTSDALEKFYHMDVAGKTKVSGAVLDRHGNPQGSCYDLGKDGSFSDFHVLIGLFFHHNAERVDLENTAIPALQKKGFQVRVVYRSEQEFLNVLKAGPNPGGQQEWNVAWIISDCRWNSHASEAVFVNEICARHRAGMGLFIWADNKPYFYHANLLLRALPAGSPTMKLVGNTPGNTVLVPGQSSAPGCYGAHLITSGVQKMHEGITICYPSCLGNFEVLGTSSNSQPVFLYAEAVPGVSIDHLSVRNTAL